MRIIYSPHALAALLARDIESGWIECTIAAPEALEPDPQHLARVRAYRVIPERDGRVLRVVYEMSGDRRGDDIVVVTAFLDRNRTRRLKR